LKITHELSTEVELLDEVFGTGCIATLHELLPSLRDYKEDPFTISKEDIENKYKVRNSKLTFGRAISLACHFSSVSMETMLVPWLLRKRSISQRKWPLS
jgi:hypothetical protein